MIIDCHAHVLACPRIRIKPGGTPFMSAEEQIAVIGNKGGTEKQWPRRAS